MDREQVSDLVHRLDDVELAVLLCLVADQHCILTTEAPHLDQLQRQLELISTNGFGLSTATIQCSANTTVEEFATASLVTADEQHPSPGLAISPMSRSSQETDSYFAGAFRGRSTSLARSASQGTTDGVSANRRIANVVIAKDLHLGNEEIHILALELMRTRRFLTKTSATINAPEKFLFVALLPNTNDRPALLVHLLDRFFISHYHPFEDESIKEAEQSDVDSLASVVIRKPTSTTPPLFPSSFYRPGPVLMPQAVINSIREYANDVTISTEVKRYLLDIVIFLRMHRAVAGGISPQATKDFELLVKCLAPLHNLDFATPALVSLAVFKIYNHRIALVRKAEDERSMLWGSSRRAVEEYLRLVDVETVVEEVLAGVKAPL